MKTEHDSLLAQVKVIAKELNIDQKPDASTEYLLQNIYQEVLLIKQALRGLRTTVDQIERFLNPNDLEYHNNIDTHDKRNNYGYPYHST